MSYYPDGVTLSSTITEGYLNSESWHFRYFYFVNGKCIAPKLTFDIEKIDIQGGGEYVDILHTNYLINKCVAGNACGQWYACVSDYDFGYGYYDGFDSVMIQIHKGPHVGTDCLGLSLNAILYLKCSIPLTSIPTTTLIPTNVPTSPTASPSASPSYSPSASPTASPYKIIHINGSYICSTLTDSIDTIYNVDYDECVHDYCLLLYGNQCAMVNYLKNSKVSSDSRCYIFNKQCEIHKEDSNNNNYIAVTGYQTNCIDYPLNWNDKSNDKCFHYTSYEWCTDASVDANHTIQEFIDHTDIQYGLNAIQTCCDCGGGAEIIDGVTIGFGVSADNDIISLFAIEKQNNFITRDNDITNHKQWNNLILYQLCSELKWKAAKSFEIIMNEELNVNHLKCNIIIDDSSINNEIAMKHELIFCNAIDNHTEVDSLFTVIIAVSNNKSNIYVNTNWFNITQLSIFSNLYKRSLPYSQCIIEMKSFGNLTYSFYGIFTYNNNNQIFTSLPTINPSVQSSEPTLYPYENSTMQSVEVNSTSFNTTEHIHSSITETSSPIINVYENTDDDEDKGTQNDIWMELMITFVVIAFLLCVAIVIVVIYIWKTDPKPNPRPYERVNPTAPPEDVPGDKKMTDQ